METALLDIAGVTIVLLAEAGRHEPPAHALRPGGALVRSCVAARVPGIAELAAQVVRELWRLRAPNADDAASEARTMAAAARLLQRHTPPAAAIAALTSERCGDSGRCAARSGAIERIVDSVVRAALVNGSLDHAGVAVNEVRAVLAAALEGALRCQDAIAAMSADILAAVHAGMLQPENEIDRWHEDRLAERTSSLCRDLGLPRALIEGLIATARSLGTPLPAIEQSLDTHVIEAIETLDALRSLADRAGVDDTIEAVLLAVVGQLRDGRIAAAEHACGEAFAAIDAAQRASQPRGDLLAHAIATHARVALTAGRLRDAAKLFQRAAQIWPTDDKLGRWRLRLAQARALARLASHRGVPGRVIAEAVQVYAEAGGIVSERDCPVEWAEANLELGVLLLRLGDAECKPERYLAAALHFKPAVEVLTRERALDDWARGQVGLADALRGQGSFQGDVVTLADAAFAYRAALGILTRGMTPELWHHAQAALGETLIRIAEETGDRATLEEGLDLLTTATGTRDPAQAPSARAIALRDLALGRAMMLLAELEPDDGTAENAADLMERASAQIGQALEAPLEALTVLERARALRTRGTIEALLGADTADTGRTHAAICAKERSRELYRALENEAEVELIDREIDDIREAMAGFGRPTGAPYEPHGTPATAPTDSGGRAALLTG